MQDIQTIIRALRCAASEREPFPEYKCSKCPYCTKDIIPPSYKGLEDGIDENGELYCMSCDDDRMMLDAADALEAAYKSKATEGETK